MQRFFNIFAAIEKSFKYPLDFLNSALTQTLSPEAYGQPKVKCRHVFHVRIDTSRGHTGRPPSAAPERAVTERTPHLENTCDWAREPRQPLGSGLEKLKCNQIKCLY